MFLVSWRWLTWLPRLTRRQILKPTPANGPAVINLVPTLPWIAERLPARLQRVYTNTMDL